MYPRPGYDKNDSRSFTYYEYIRVDEEARTAREYSAYDGRRLILNGQDVHITHFKECKSPYYISVLKDVIEEHRNRYTNDKSLAATEKTKINELIDTYMNICDQYANYPCVMLVLNKWFMSSSANYVDDYYEKVTSWCDDLDSILSKFNSKVRSIKSEFKKGLPSWYDNLKNAFNEASPNNRNNHSYGPFGSYLDLGKMNNNFVSSANFNKECLEVFDKKANRCKEAKKDIEEELENILFEGEYIQDETNPDFTKIKSSMQAFVDFTDFLKAYENGETSAFSDYVNEIVELISELDELVRMINSFNSTKVSLLTMASKLVCRCGGVISIVYGGGWIDKAREKAEENLINLLKKIQKDIYNQIIDFEENNYNYGKYRSLVGGFQMMHYLIQELDSVSEYADSPLLESEGYIGSIDILIQPQSIIDKKNANISGLQNLSSAIPFLSIGDILTTVYAVNDIRTGDPELDSVRDFLYEAANVAAKVSKKVAEEILSILGYLGVVISIHSVIKALLDFTYCTNSDYTGQITVTVKMAKSEYTYNEVYDIEGNVLSYDEPNYRDISGPVEPIKWRQKLEQKAKLKYVFNFKKMMEVVEEEYDLKDETD